MQTVETTAQTTPTVKATKIGFFPGAFGQFQATAFRDLEYGGYAPEIAHLVATDYGADIGNALRNGDDFGTKIAKAKSDGESRLSINGKGMVRMSNTMALIRVVQQVATLHKETLLSGYTVQGLEMSKDIRDYLKEVSVRASKTTWA